MPAVTYNCEFEGCDWKQNTATAKAKKAKRPEITSDVSDEDWL